MISVIIVNYNGKHWLRNCLDSLYEANGNKEIIVIDNGSTDRSRHFLYEEAVAKDIRVFDYYLNEGLAKAGNKGAELAKGEWLFFLNNDTKVDKNIFTELLKAGKKFNLMGCKMYSYDGKQKLDSALTVDRFGYPAGERTNRTFYCDGAIFIKKKLFDKLGGFDEKMFLYGEDRDLCWRALLMGHMCHYVDTAIFYHASTSVMVNGTSQTKAFQTNYFRRKLSEQNIIRSMLKNYSVKSLLSILPQYMVWSILELGLMLFIKPQAIWRVYLPAYWWNIVNLKNTIRQRRKVQVNRIVPDWSLRLFMTSKIGKLFVLRKFGLPQFTKRTR